MLTDTILRLQYLCDTIPPLLERIADEEFSEEPAPGKWSRKQELGHLIDSAANNHQRFVRAQFEDTPEIMYDQDQWNDCSRYSLMDPKQVIAFWAAYNRYLLQMIQLIPDNMLARKCKTNETEPVTVQWLIEDYVKHMEHHLRHIVDYGE